MLYYSALFVGLLGSLHCVGMCGPIALALPQANNGRYALLYSRLLYNLGRVFTYSILGLVVGLLGKGLMLAGTQQAVSIALGVIILLVMLLPKRLTYRLEQFSPFRKAVQALKKSFGKLFLGKGRLTFLWLGLLNGLLPCGLVYLALAGAIATGEYWGGALYMALFGLGTVPMMLGVSLAGNFIKPSVRSWLYRRLVPVFTVMLALLFILRGLNLGIPYVSPKIHQSHANGVEMECCHK